MSPLSLSVEWLSKLTLKRFTNSEGCRHHCSCAQLYHKLCTMSTLTMIVAICSTGIIHLQKFAEITTKPWVDDFSYVLFPIIFGLSFSVSSLFILILTHISLFRYTVLFGYPAYSHHDKIPPWWENVSNDEGGNVSVSKNHHTPLHHDELYFEVYMYKVTHITSVSFGINF